MATKNTKQSIGQQIVSKFNSIGGVILVAITLVGAGAGVASYFSNIINKIEIEKLNRIHFQEMIDVKEDYDSVYKNQQKRIEKLEYENLKLKENE
ncbi:MAG TPA: hypothetical protein PKN32_06305 [Bacteroidales bacterium]|nr:hypothetical protein [Bacteroidales bacterium]